MITESPAAPRVLRYHGVTVATSVTASRASAPARLHEHSMAIQISPAARERMQQYLARTPAAVGVRFGIRRTGCSGFGYTVDLADGVAADDAVFEQDGLRLVVERKALPFVDGTEIDFRRDGLNAAFVFRNPNATGECGCGESFTVETPA